MLLLKLNYPISQNIIDMIVLSLDKLVKPNPMTQSPNIPRKQFYLAKIKATCKFDLTRVDFQMPFSSNPSSRSGAPSFNNDGLEYTSSFILPQSNKETLLRKERELNDFQNRKKQCWNDYDSQNISSNSQILYLAAPNTKYCSVCHNNFEDYFEHIELNSHKIAARSPKTIKWVEELANKISKKRKEQRKKKKSKHIKKCQMKLPSPKKKQSNAENNSLITITKPTSLEVISVRSENDLF